jgi:hypothetical protein
MSATQPTGEAKPRTSESTITAVSTAVIRGSVLKRSARNFAGECRNYRERMNRFIQRGWTFLLPLKEIWLRFLRGVTAFVNKNRALKLNGLRALC